MPAAHVSFTAVRPAPRFDRRRMWCDGTAPSVPDLGRWRPGAGIASMDGVTYRRLLMSRTTLE
jgi:hypothetical protein